MMKIAIICKSVKYIKDELKSLIYNIYSGGTDVTLMAPEEKDDEISGLFPDFDYYSFGYNEVKSNFFSDFATTCSLIGVLRKDKPDIVLCVSARLCSVAAIASRLTGVLEVYSVMSDLENLITNSSPFGKNHSRQRSKIISRCSTKVLFHNTDTMLYFINRKLVKHKKAALVNGFGVDMNKFKKTDYVNTRKFLMITKLSMDKGIFEYAQTADILKMLGRDASFTLVGYTEDCKAAFDLDMIKPYIKSGSLKYIDGKDCNIVDLLKECSCFVYPSYNEGIPQHILEALATARPIITTDVSGCRDAVTEGYNGHLVPIQSVEKLVATILKVVDDGSELPRMAEKSFEICKTKFDRNLTDERMLEILELKGEA